jgi:class 3 adenylate cyclase
MIKPAASNLSANLKPGGFKLFLVWLFLLVFPITSFIGIFKIVINESEKRIRQDYETKLQTEMKYFKHELAPEVFIENFFKKTLSQILQGGTVLEHEKNAINRISSLNATTFRAAIEKRLKMPVAMVFAHGPNTKHISYSFSKEVKKHTKIVSKSLVQKLFLSLNTQYNKTSLFNEKLPHSWRKYKRARYKKQLKKRANNFINTQFKNAGILHLQPNEVIPDVSGHFYLGKIYFAYIPVNLKFKSKKSGNLNGFLCVIRDRDLDLNKIFTQVKSRTFFPEIKRTLLAKNFKSSSGFHEYQPVKTVVKESKDGLDYINISPGFFVKNYVNKSFYSLASLDKALQRFPFLKVSVNRKYLKHPFRKYLNQIKPFLLIFLLISSTLLLRIYFFGLNFRLNISYRLLISLLIACYLPYATLWLFSSYYQHFRKNYNLNSIINDLNLKIEIFSKALESHISAVETKTQQHNRTLNFQDLSTIEKTKKALRPILESDPTAYISFYSPQFECAVSEPNIFLSTYEKTFKDFICSGIFSAMEANKASTPKAGRKFKVGLLSHQSGNVSRFLVGDGKLMTLSHSNLGAKYAFLPIYKNNDKSKNLSAMILLKFFIRDLLLSLKKAGPQYFLNEKLAKYDLKKCYIPISQTTRLPSSPQFICSKDFPLEQIKPFLLPILKKKGSDHFFIDSEKQKTLLKVAYIDGAQCLVALAAQINDSNDNFSILPSLWALGVYLTVLTFLIVYYLRSTFIYPIASFNKAAAEIGNGNLNIQLKLKTGDEFELLSDTFNKMTYGLKQREKLSEFVSNDVLSAVKEDLQPGGELIEASVLFCSLKNFKKTSANRTPHQNLQLLSQFIDLLDRATKQNHGTIDKIIEDTIMVIFMNSKGKNDAIINACNAAIAISSILPSAELDFKCGIGISSGQVISGKIGSTTGKLDFTVIGNPVNLAARLKAQTHKATQTGILLCPNSIRLLRGKGRLQFIERLQIKGRTRTFPLYELIGMRE